MRHALQVRAGRVRRGVSLVELMVAMAGVSVVVTSSAMLIHGAMRAHSESRRFFDDERTSARLARAFRADVHAASAIAPLAEGVLVSLESPDGRRVDYARPFGARRLERRERKADGTPTGPREDFHFGAEFAAAVAVSGSQIRLELGADDGQGGVAAAGSMPAPDSSARARQTPPAIVVEANLGRDHRFATAPGGEEQR